MAKNFKEPWNKESILTLTPENAYLVEFESREYKRHIYKNKNVFKHQALVRYQDLKFYLDQGIKIKILN